MDRYELRRLDYSLSEDHRALQAAYQGVDWSDKRNWLCNKGLLPTRSKLIS